MQGQVATAGFLVCVQACGTAAAASVTREPRRNYRVVFKPAMCASTSDALAQP